MAALHDQGVSVTCFVSTEGVPRWWLSQQSNAVNSEASMHGFIVFIMPRMGTWQGAPLMAQLSSDTLGVVAERLVPAVQWAVAHEDCHSRLAVLWTALVHGMFSTGGSCLCSVERGVVTLCVGCAEPSSEPRRGFMAQSARAVQTTASLVATTGGSISPEPVQ
jgi:hypothetical protein